MLNNRQLINLIIVGLFLLGTEPAIAQSIANSSAKTNRLISQVRFKPPPNQGKPKKTSGAGTRRDWLCPQDVTLTTSSNISLDQPSAIALVPNNTNYGLTLAERPTFLVYLPQTSAKQVVLSLMEEGTKHHSQTFFPITGESGVIAVTIPNNSPPLSVGKNYQWALVLVCGEKPSPNDPTIASWVSRVALPQPPTSQKTPLEQANWYSEKGIWYDALTALAQAKKAQPNNKAITDIWTDFLKSTGLEVVVTEPLRMN
ncbi:hypothetical protein WA1_09190 [Scytonema hofmannii PCC 7110]|uniref:DUF928 domain-containing protein n=1 Tax=Scytonema hofmannii PCC 7110 TaxID=128403 RepID=A0A139WSA2_9CYAN|nr:DUF928 domain-containing protein [Scytonema hofmannii]KYC35312.1 hypothetical protein WA1_09190 [Scytonema hofmannii PCC 7110]